MIKWCSRELITGPYLALCTTEKDFHKALKKLGVPVADWSHWIDPDAHARTHALTAKGKFCCIVCIEANPEGILPAQIVALLAHEAVHVKQKYMEFIGERDPSPEFEAYVVQNIVQELVLAYPYEEE